MKKYHLVSAALACTVAASLMVGAAYAPQEAYTDPAQAGNAVAAVRDIADSASEKASVIGALVNQAAEDRTAAQAEAEREAERVAAAEANASFKSSTTTNSNNSNSSSNKSNSSSSSESKSSTSKSTRTITVDGVTMNYTESYGASSAPNSGAGVWKGSDSTTDGSYGYFIGHNPGSFGSAATASNGSKVTVNDSNGDSRTYTVVDSFVVPRGSTWGDISDRVTGHGESVVLQTCVEDGYKVVVAE